MAWKRRDVPHCDECGHEWITTKTKKDPPTHCARCKSRLWNGSTVPAPPPRRRLATRKKK